MVFSNNLQKYLVGGIFFWQFVPTDAKKLSKFLLFQLGQLKYYPQQLWQIRYCPFCFFSGRYDFMYAMSYCFWNVVLFLFFYSAKNDVDSKFFYFALLVQLFHSCIFCMAHAWSISVAFFCFYHPPIKFILFLHWKINASSYPWLRYYFVSSSYFTVIIG